MKPEVRCICIKDLPECAAPGRVGINAPGRIGIPQRPSGSQRLFHVLSPSAFPFELWKVSWNPNKKPTAKSVSKVSIP